MCAGGYAGVCQFLCLCRSTHISSKNNKHNAVIEKKCVWKIAAIAKREDNIKYSKMLM